VVKDTDRTVVGGTTHYRQDTDTSWQVSDWPYKLRRARWPKEFAGRRDEYLMFRDALLDG
jgi:hypothetical protein